MKFRDRENISQHYMKQTTIINPLKPQIMNEHIEKSIFNINGTTIHFAFTIPLNKNYNELND